MKTGLWILHGITALIFGAVLELNHSRWIGWILFVAAVVLFPLLAGKWKTAGKHALLYFGSILLYVLIILFAWPRPEAVPAVAVKNPNVTGTVAVEHGMLTGVFNRDHSVEVYAGIPYAKAPVGELRWKKPQEEDDWDGILACDHFAPMSMQTTSLPIVDSLTQIIGYHDYHPFTSHSVAPVSEDSLYLNIWKPAGEQRNLPVIVYIHGGSLKTGQPWFQDYNGESLAKKGAIVVNMGYRLGVFGFLAEDEFLKEEGTTGNYGLLDQIKALQWVQKNITAFGGDPGNVTISGESAGSVCVDALCVSPLAEGLFGKAILESSTVSSVKPPHSYRLFDEALFSGKDLMARYGCASASELRNLPAEKIVGELDSQHHITIDGYVLPDTPHNLRAGGVHNESAILHGFNKEESGPFILFDQADLKDYESKVRAVFGEAADDVLKAYPASTDAEAKAQWALIYGAKYFNYSHYCLNRLAVGQNEPVYEYFFTKNNGRLSSWHSGELPYAYGNLPAGSSLFQKSDYDLSEYMQNCWINFAVSGDPNAPGSSEFAQNTDSTKLMELGDHIGMIDEPFLKLYEILDRYEGE
ncbi:MAG: carboxylesterase family protein [Solobacterium sp.]|nr:carboxylesterase family protein [Solobacterium sp.]